MALVFSKILATSKDNNIEFLVGGEVKSKENLDNWIIFEEFLNDLDKGDDVEILSQTYRYGEDEDNDATPEEIVYFMQRIEMRPDFIEMRTEKITENKFCFKIN